MLYRVRKLLSTGHQPGDVVQGTDFREGVAEILVEKEMLVEVSTPPLSQLPGWRTRAKALARAGIITVQDLLDTEEEAIRKAVEHKTTRAVKKWKQEAVKWLTAPESNCGRC